MTNEFDKRGNLLPNEHVTEFENALYALCFWATTEAEVNCVEATLKSLVGKCSFERRLKLKSIRGDK